MIPLPGAVDYAGVALITNGSAARSNVIPDTPTTYSAATTFTVPSVSCRDATTGMIDGTGVFSSISNWVSAGGVVVECSGGVLTYSSQAIINNVIDAALLDTGPRGHGEHRRRGHVRVRGQHSGDRRRPHPELHQHDDRVRRHGGHLHVGRHRRAA